MLKFLQLNQVGQDTEQHSLGLYTNKGRLDMELDTTGIKTDMETDMVNLDLEQEPVDCILTHINTQVGRYTEQHSLSHHTEQEHSLGLDTISLDTIGTKMDMETDMVSLDLKQDSVGRVSIWKLFVEYKRILYTK